MPLKVTRINVRPSILVPWFLVPKEMLDQRAAKVESTGLVTPPTFIVSEDGLTRTQTKVWKDRETREASITDPVIAELNNMAEAYDAANGITGTVEFEEV